MNPYLTWIYMNGTWNTNIVVQLERTRLVSLSIVEVTKASKHEPWSVEVQNDQERNRKSKIPWISYHHETYKNNAPTPTFEVNPNLRGQICSFRAKLWEIRCSAQTTCGFWEQTSACCSLPITRQLRSTKNGFRYFHVIMSWQPRFFHTQEILSTSPSPMWSSLVTSSTRKNPQPVGPHLRCRSMGLMLSIMEKVIKMTNKGLTMYPYYWWLKSG